MNFFDKVKEKINKKINPENIILIDNSHLHTEHKSFDPNKLHIKVIIKSKFLREMEKIRAHKIIFSIRVVHKFKKIFCKSSFRLVSFF